MEENADIRQDQCQSLCLIARSSLCRIMFQELALCRLASGDAWRLGMMTP